MPKKNIAVVMGGPSSEHEVSLATGASMIENLNKNKYQVIKVVIGKDYAWNIDGKKTDTVTALKRLKESNATVLIALHGTFGEDGTIQALLERYGITYTGSGVGASLLAMDKTVSGEMFEKNGLKAPKTVILTSKQDAGQKIEKVMSLPVVVKPARNGSSVGVHIVKQQGDLAAALDDAFLYDQTVLAQEYVKGREVACGVIENWQGKKITALPPTELIPKNAEFFDYEAKYTAGMTDEITPPEDMSDDTIKQIQELAVKAHEVLGCALYSRTDMIVTDSEVYVIELNNLPGMTKTSLLPQQAQAAGLGFSEMLDILVDNAK